MKPARIPTFLAEDAAAPPPRYEAAPARNGVRFLAISVFLVLFLLAGRAVQLAFSGDPLAEPRHAPGVAVTARADIVDRNGVLLATTVRAFTLTATPANVWDARATAAALRGVFPDLDAALTERRLRDKDHDLVFLRRGLSPEERARVLALGLGGIGFAPEDRRDYPQGALAAHALGFVNVDLAPMAGVEYGLNRAIRDGGANGKPVRLSLDVRLQYIVETELARAATQAHASGGAAILLDAKSGETLAMASWPAFDPNQAGAATDDARRDRVAGDVHELGSTIKPFTLAMALDDHLTTTDERFDLMQPFVVDGQEITDYDDVRGMSGLREILAFSSNRGAARLALRVGAQRQRYYLDRLGLLSPATIESGRRQAPIAPRAQSQRDVAGLGFGYGLAATPAALAGAYTVFANDGMRVTPTLLARAAGDPAPRTPVFTPQTTRAILADMRATVTDGTGKAADVPGLEIAGKTGTAEKLGEDRTSYERGRNFSSFAAVFPASAPRYVMLLSLDDVGFGAAGGAVAAPAVARIAERAAPMLGLRVTRPAH
ncbi:MAG TPA: penicillin-binding protein 2 [Caulobacterales bacterium]|nr:penicillin-binding protein 2 [Caulobacterales bacterium]